MCELLKVLRPGGKALIYVWAVEQELNKVKSKYLKQKHQEDESLDSARKAKLDTSSSASDTNNAECDNGATAMELGCLATGDCKDQSSCQAAAQGEENEKVQQQLGNKRLEVHINRTEFKQQDVLVPWQLKNKHLNQTAQEESPNTFHRFYHVFQKGELENLCKSTGLCEVIDSYYDQGNWAVILEKT